MFPAIIAEPTSLVTQCFLLGIIVPKTAEVIPMDPMLLNPQLKNVRIGSLNYNPALWSVTHRAYVAIVEALCDIVPSSIIFPRA